MNGRTRSEVESVLVYTIMIGSIIWVLCHEMLVSNYVHWQFQLDHCPSPAHCSIFVGIPLLVGVIFYSSWKMVRLILRHRIFDITSDAGHYS